MAGPGSGLGSSFGTGIETTYGTLPTIDKWPTVDSAELKRAPVYAEGNGLHTGSLVRYGTERVLTNQDAAGPIKMAFYHTLMGQLVGSIMGTLNITPTVLTGTAYQQVHAWGNSWNQSFTIQQGIVDVNQTVHNWLTLGCKVTDAQFDCAAGGGLNCQFTVDAQDRYEAVAAITTPVETATPYFSWADMQVKVGAYGSEAKVDGCHKWTGTFKRQLDTKRFNAGNVTTNPSLVYGVKDQPVDDNFADIGGTLETEYLNDSLYENYFLTETPFSLIVVFTSTALAGTGNPFSVSFAFPECYFTGTDPTVMGPGIVKPSMPFKVYNDGTHAPATITIVSTDTTL